MVVQTHIKANPHGVYPALVPVMPVSPRSKHYLDRIFHSPQGASYNSSGLNESGKGRCGLSDSEKANEGVNPQVW